MAESISDETGGPGHENGHGLVIFVAEFAISDVIPDCGIVGTTVYLYRNSVVFPV